MSERRERNDRRRPAQRRSRARRRKGDQRLLVIELTADELRVAELRRGAADGAADTVSAAAFPWRRDAATLHSPEGTAELTAALRDVARRYSPHPSEIRMVLSGEYCVLRTIRGPVEEVRAELQQLEQRSRLYLSLGPGEKVLVSNTRAIDARHAYSLAAACNRTTLDAIQAAAETAGLDISVIEPGLTALNRAVGRLADVPSDPYLLVHFNRSAMEIGVCHQGQLLLDYRPGGQTQVVDLPTLLESHLSRLSRHVGRYLRLASSDLKCVFLCGDAAAVEVAKVQFRKHSHLEVRSVRPQDVRATWQLSDSQCEGVTATALGAMLASYLPETEWDAPNLMQHILERQREPLRPRLIRSAIPLAATMLISLGLTVANSYQQRDLDVMQREFDSLAAGEGRATQLRLQLISSDGKLKELEKLASRLPSLLGGEVVRQLAQCMPSDVWLNRLEMLDYRTVRLDGASYQEAGVYDFVRWLEQAPGLVEVALKRTNQSSSASGPTTNFELELSLEALAAAKVAANPPLLPRGGSLRSH